MCGVGAVYSHRSKQYLFGIRCHGQASPKKRLLHQMRCNSKSLGLRTRSAGIDFIALLLVAQLACDSLLRWQAGHVA